MIRAAITMRVVQAPDYDEPRDALSHDWLDRAAQWDMTPFPVPNAGAAAVDILKSISPDLLVLSGGEDPGVNERRDNTESALLDYALKTGLPILGVCRGLQFINVRMGGTLCDVTGHVARDHSLTFADPWHAYYGATANVNSYHNKSIERRGLADGLEVTAVDGDGHVEAARVANRPVAAVMWHPERGAALDGDRRLIEALVEKA